MRGEETSLELGSRAPGVVETMPAAGAFELVAPEPTEQLAKDDAPGAEEEVDLMLARASDWHRDSVVTAELDDASLRERQQDAPR